MRDRHGCGDAQFARKIPLVKSEYLERILKARVYDVAIESPLEPAARRDSAKAWEAV